MTRRIAVGGAVSLLLLLASCTGSPPATSSPSVSPSVVPAEPASEAPSVEPSPVSLEFSTEAFPLPPGTHPHDVAPAADGGVWYTAQHTGRLGWLDPETGETREIPLGAGSAPHGVVVGPDEAAWVTDGGLNAIVRVDPETDAVAVYRLPAVAANANLNTAAFDGEGILWFTGQAGWYGRVNPATATVEVWAAPRGPGPYGITATPDGEIYYASLAGSYLGAVDTASGEVSVIEPPTAGAGVRRAWSDSTGRIWISEWNAGQVGVYDPADGSWQEWRLPGTNPQAYSVYVDEVDAVWLTEFTADAIVRFDPESESFQSFPPESTPSAIRQMLGRDGEVWGAESAADRLVVVRYE
ncbi:MAG TPA: lyase [Candidatus Limnocylindria bacterium]|nr:lyase [Candidatus Limnocylindria bacterium]